MASFFGLNTLQAGGESAIASTIPWPKIQYIIVAQNREVSDVLSELAQQHGVRSVVSQNVKGRISGRFENIPPGDLLSQLSRSFNLVWMFYNGILYIGTPIEVQSSFVTLRYAKPDTVLSSLANVGIISPGASVSNVEGTPLLSITGLPAFVDVNKHIAETLDNQEQFRQQGEMVIEVFPLNYAWAYDVTIGNSGDAGTGAAGSNNVIKGVATLLNELVNDNGQGGNIVSEAFSTSGKPQAMVGALGPKEAAETARLGFYTGPAPQQGNAPQGGAAAASAPAQAGGPPGSYITRAV